MPLADLRLVQRETELLTTMGGKLVSRSSESMSQISLRVCSGFTGTASIVCQSWHKVAGENCSTNCSSEK
jgi:hypothetical protein